MVLDRSVLMEDDQGEEEDDRSSVSGGLEGAAPCPLEELGLAHRDFLDVSDPFENLRALSSSRPGWNTIANAVFTLNPPRPRLARCRCTPAVSWSPPGKRVPARWGVPAGGDTERTRLMTPCLEC